MIKLKITIILIGLFVLVTSCSYINKLKEELSKKDTDKKETTTEGQKEKTVSGNENDLKFYNTYIDVINKISAAADDLNKDYLNEIPNPKSLRKSSFILAVSSSNQLGTIESLIKQYKRSYYDNGELAKLESDNREMKKDIENDFQSTLNSLEDYHRIAVKVIGYYQNKEYQNDLSRAVGYDEEMKGAYSKYKDAFTKFNGTVKRYKPKRVQRNPDDYSNPDEKAVAILLNTYENALDKAEAFYSKFENFKKGDNADEILETVNDYEKAFETDKNKVLSISFSDRTKYMKYSFEDYFSKTVTDFLRESKKFLDNIKSSKMDERKFNDGYNVVIRYYNYMIDSYNSSIITLNSYKVY